VKVKVSRGKLRALPYNGQNPWVGWIGDLRKCRLRTLIDKFLRGEHCDITIGEGTVIANLRVIKHYN